MYYSDCNKFVDFYMKKWENKFNLKTKMLFYRHKGMPSLGSSHLFKRRDLLCNRLPDVLSS